MHIHKPYCVQRDAAMLRCGKLNDNLKLKKNMLQDTNVERVIKNYTEPLQKQISMMQIELEALKQQCNIGAVMHWVATTDSLPTSGSYVWAAKIGDDKSKLIKWGTGDESFYDVWQHATAPKPPCA